MNDPTPYQFPLPALPEKWQAYKPLLVIGAIVSFVAFDLWLAGNSFMNMFMGLFFLFFASFKLMDINAFADGFCGYDLIAARSRAYAYAYPFIELLLAVSYLSGFAPLFTNGFTLLLMAVGGAGVIHSISKGRKLNCACLGKVMSVPLSVVSVVENLGMGLMALLMLFML